MVSGHNNNAHPPAKLILAKPVHLLAVGLGSGLSPKAPGTSGSFVAVIIYSLLLVHIDVVWQLALLVLLFFCGLYICGQTAKDWNAPDHGAIVWDEWVGQWMVLIALPDEVTGYVLGFLLFRLFDVWKPWPIGWIDSHIHGGLGIMIDDIIAGFMAILTYTLISAGYLAVTG